MSEESGNGGEIKMLVSFALCKNGKILGIAKYFEDLEYFVEELKRLNSKWIDRREFKIMSGNEIIKEWTRK